MATIAYDVVRFCFRVLFLDYVSGLCFWIICVLNMFLDYVPGLCVWITFLEYVSGLCFWIMFLDYVSGLCFWIMFLYYLYFFSFANHYTTHLSSRTCSQLTPYPGIKIHLNVRSPKMCNQSYFSYMCILQTTPIKMCNEFYFS